MGSDVVVQHDDETPTGSRSTSFFIRGILGPDAWSIFMRWLRRLAERFPLQASPVGHPGDSWRLRLGCSIGAARAAWRIWLRSYECFGAYEIFRRCRQIVHASYSLLF